MAANRCIWFVITIWLIMMARLCYNIGDIDYLNDATPLDYSYFIFYYILAWNLFEIYAILGVDTPISVWKKLEDQFVRLQSENNYQPHNHINLTNDNYNTYSYSFNKSTDLSLDYIEFNMSDPNNNFTYSFSNLYEVTDQYTKPVVFRSLLPTKQSNDLLYLLNKYGKSKVPTLLNEYDENNHTTIRHKFKKTGMDYLQLNDIELDKLFLNKNINNHTTFDTIKLWKICSKQNNLETWNYFNLHILEIPQNEIAAAGFFVSNLPSKKRINDNINGSPIDEWYLTSDWHSDSGPSLFMVLKGRKLWRLIDIKYTHLMRQDWFGTYSRSFGHDSKHFNLIPRYEIILNEGDVLYFPPWMWHEVYVDHNIGFDLSVGIKMTREGNLMTNIKESALFTLNLIGGVLNQQIFYGGEGIKSC